MRQDDGSVWLGAGLRFASNSGTVKAKWDEGFRGPEALLIRASSDESSIIEDEEFLILEFLRNRLRLRPSSDVSMSCVLGGWLLILLTCTCVALMPLLEHFWASEKSLRSGQDIWFSLLSIGALLCLALVLSQHLKRTFGELLVVLRIQELVTPRPIRVHAFAAIPSRRAELFSSPALCLYDLPLQI